MAGFEHYCQQAEDREAEARNLAWFSHLSGDNRARMGWPIDRLILALQLSGETFKARLLTDELAHRLRERNPDRPIPEIPHQRQRELRLLPQQRPLPSEPQLVEQLRQARFPPSQPLEGRSDIDNNRGGR